MFFLNFRSRNKHDVILFERFSSGRTIRLIDFVRSSDILISLIVSIVRLYYGHGNLNRLMTS